MATPNMEEPMLSKVKEVPMLFKVKVPSFKKLLAFSGMFGILLVLGIITLSASQVPTQQNVAATLIGKGGSFDCMAYPGMCLPPLSCQTYNGPNVTEDLNAPLALDGHSNPRSFCFFPEYGDYIKACIVDKDLVEAAKIQYNHTRAGKYGEFTNVTDATYCFLEGFCTNHDVTPETTLAEAEVLCDERFGHEAWSELTLAQAGAVLGPAYAQMTGAHQEDTKDAADMGALMACAQGNFACDVISCQVTYCKDPYWKAKYGHLAP